MYWLEGFFLIMLLLRLLEIGFGIKYVNLDLFEFIIDEEDMNCKEKKD